MPGIKPKGKVKIEWSSNFAYAIGLIVSDGCVSNDGKNISFTSKDIDQIQNYLKSLNTQAVISKVYSGYNGGMAYRIQICDVLFVRFLKSIGITQAKSLTINKVLIPDQYFFDFLRGEFDGDGYFHSYWDKRWKSSFMFYTGFVSGSINYINWLQTVLHLKLNINGHVTKAKKTEYGNYCFQLKYAKKESLILLKVMYDNAEGKYLMRKKLKINKALGIIGLSLR